MALTWDPATGWVDWREERKAERKLVAARKALLETLRLGQSTLAWALQHGGPDPNKMLRLIWERSITPGHLMQIARAMGPEAKTKAIVYGCECTKYCAVRLGHDAPFTVTGRCATCAREIRVRIRTPTLGDLK